MSRYVSEAVMLWQEDISDNIPQVPEEVVDVLFSVECRKLPVDHAFALSAELQKLLPWIGEDNARVGVHVVHVAGSQNGWERPEHGTDHYLVPSKRTKLTVRVPKERVPALMAGLAGKTCEVAGCRLKVGSGKVRALSRQPTLFARHVVDVPRGTEEDFYEWTLSALEELDIKVRKALCGKLQPLATPKGTLATRSLMLANLSPGDSLRLQQTGIGPNRAMGCGIFIPHKGIDAVGKAS